MDDDYQREIELRMRRADAARVARHLGHHAYARKVEKGRCDEGLAMTALGPFFREVTLIGPRVPAHL